MSPKTSKTRDELLSAVDAAKVLGLSADMVRLLAREGRLPAAAQTVRGLRLFRRGDVEELAAERAGYPAHKHAVQFYEKDEFLCAAVTSLVAEALRAGAPAVVIATEDHRREIRARLEEAGLDVGRACETSQLAIRDAREVLETFMVDGVPDPDRFATQVGGILRVVTAARPRGRLRIYGEMVDLLWLDGRHDAAIKLEELWNELGLVHSFSLLCAYGMGNFREPGHVERFQQICGTHTHVLPAETYPRYGDMQECLREIALLQQRAHALEGEIEQRLAVEEALRQSREELRQQNEKLEAATQAKDEVLAILGHELSDPLAPIQTAFALMRVRGLASREQNLVERQVGYLARLAGDLLDASQLGRGKLELHVQRIELAEVVARAIETSGPLLERRQHPVDVEVPAGLIVVVDPDRMAQVVVNLLANASKYSDRGTPIQIRASREGASVRLSVKDQGIGMTPEVIGRVFDSFARRTAEPERPGSGLGLGLAIAHSLVKLHGGTVAAHSEGKGKGSEFVVEIQAADVALSEPARSPAAAQQEPSPNARARRVLVVDDNVDLASLIAELLEHLGHQVELAHDGHSALDAAARFRPEVALLDIGLPVMDGYELARQLRTLGDGKIHLVAITGFGQDADRRLSEEAGFAGHLLKPVDPKVLATVVDLAGFAE